MRLPIERMAGRLGNRLFQVAYLHAKVLRGEIPDIFVQDPTYFEEFAPEIRKLFGDGIYQDERDITAMHVRRGDYITVEKAFVNLAEHTDYYERSMEMFPGSQVIIFSDDPEWCKSRWPKALVSEGRTELQDLNMMASCRNVIIANSSFSWWAGFLKDPSQGLVVYPSAWYTDGIPRVKFPADWRQVSCAEVSRP